MKSWVVGWSKTLGGAASEGSSEGGGVMFGSDLLVFWVLRLGTGRLPTLAFRL